MWFLAVWYRNRVPTIKLQANLFDHTSHICLSNFKHVFAIIKQHISMSKISNNRKWYHSLGVFFFLDNTVFCALFKIKLDFKNTLHEFCVLETFCINFSDWFQTADDVISRLVAAHYHFGFNHNLNTRFCCISVLSAYFVCPNNVKHLTHGWLTLWIYAMFTITKSFKCSSAPFTVYFYFKLFI